MGLAMRRVAAAAALALLATGLVPGQPASASIEQGSVVGTGAVRDDWGDEGPISRTRYAVSGATMLWQLVLYADGYLEFSDVDCVFGPRTQAATRRWQENHGYLGTGEVNRATFGLADDFLYRGTGNWVHYDGIVEDRTVSFIRNGSYRISTERFPTGVASYTSSPC